MASSQQSPTTDATNLYTILTEPRRRHVLKILSDTDRPISLADLAADIAAEETGEVAEEIDQERIKSIYLSLYHIHVPKMRDLGVVQYKTSRQTVTLNESQPSAELSYSVAGYE